MESKLKHLEMLQTIISRMASNSFFIKGWCITLVSALFVLGSNSSNLRFFILAYFPVIMFWLLDAYYLWQERLFRKLYDKVRASDESSIDFSMNTQIVINEVSSWTSTVFSSVLVIFYGAIILAIILTVLIARP